ncbi:finTRIM family, member 86 [Brachyhypopomus gauderio]|uniref:finTRIM family, member 86 n=1 Tax=Brachyhypopomus gauderio TaxID=698409 RepID=UPI004042B734
MATSSCPPDMFSCAVCLEVLCDPATLPCGHTYCLQCIQKHWDKAAKGVYSCPQCRQVFKPRPCLGRNNMLMEAMKKLSVREQDRPPSPVCSSVAPSADTHVDFSAQAAPPNGVGEPNEGGPVQEGLYPQLPHSSPELCPLHQQVLELYCCDDKEKVCDECSLLGHKGHRVVRPDEERNEKQRKLATLIQKCIHDRQQIIQTLPQVFQAHKDAVQGLQTDSLEIHAEAMKSVESMSSHVTELLHNYESSYYNRLEANRYRLQHEISQLAKREEELNRLSNTEDSIQFLHNIDSMMDVEQVGSAGLQMGRPEEEAGGIGSALGAFREGLHDFLKGSLTTIFRAVNDAAVTATEPPAQASASGPLPPTASGPLPPTASGPLPPTASGPLPPSLPATSQKSEAASIMSKPLGTTPDSCTPHQPPPPSASSVKKLTSFSVENPAPKTREEMFKFRFEPTLDHNSEFRHIRLSDGDRKATLRAENQNYPDHAERFLYWRQVMCREPLAGSPYYWEVEWTGQKVTIGVAYKDMGRSASDNSSRIGYNDHSWGLYWSGTSFSLWHDGKETTLAAPKARCVGIYLDQQAGVLAFYRVLHKQAHQICCIETEFSGPLYPSFRFWSAVGSTITLCQLE